MATFNIQKILVPLDFSQASEKALDQATLMAKKNNAEVVLLTAIEGPPDKTRPEYFGFLITSREKVDKLLTDWGKTNLDAVKSQLKKHGVKKVKCMVVKGTAYRSILRVAEEIKPDIIVMGTHGISGIREFITGSNAFKVVSEANCPVLSIQHHTEKAGFKNILVPFRDKAHSREKVDYAIHMAKVYGATMHILGMSYDTDEAARRKLQLEADQIKTISGKSGVETTETMITGPFRAKAILQYAKRKKADLIVVISDLDRSEISQYFTGPVVQQLVNHSHIPVLSIHPKINPKLMIGSGDWSFWA